MKKILYAAVAMLGVCGYGNAMDTISYHSLVEAEGKEKPVPRPTCYNSAELQDRMAKGTWRFVEASPLSKEKVAKELVPEYEAVFCTDADQLSVLRELENEVDAQASATSLKETVDGIVYLCNGLPAAATKIQRPLKNETQLDYNS